MERVCREVCRSVKGVKAMKLTIEAVYEKFIGRTDKFPEHFEDFAADIQAYVKQEMKKLVSPIIINGKVWCGDCNEWERDKTIITEDGLVAHYPQNIVIRGDTHVVYVNGIDILTAIENYGKDKGGL